MIIQLDVNRPAPFTPIFLPNNPDTIALNKGINNTKIYTSIQTYIYILMAAS